MIEQVIIIGLAAWRLGSLISKESGPFAIFDKVRNFLLPSGRMSSIQYEIYLALDCMWCMTVWTAMLLFLVWLITPWPVILLAAMSVAVIAEKIINKDE